MSLASRHFSHETPPAPFRGDPGEMAPKGRWPGRDTARSVRYGGYETVEGVCR
jgi:hypothetical protein